MHITLVIPAYNEEKRIGRMLDAYLHYFEEKRKGAGFDYSILVAINNTTDNTKEVVQDYAKRNKRITFLDLPLGGKGYAVIEGFKHALKEKNDYIGFVDADLATPPSSFYSLLLNIRGSSAAIANRYLKDSKIYPRMTFRRVIVGTIFNFFVRTLFWLPYTDTQCGAKLFDSRALSQVVPRLGVTQWAFDIELLYEFFKRGYPVLEISTEWKDIEGSKVKLLKTSIQMVLACIQLRIIKSRFHRFLKILKPFIVLLWRITK